MFFISIRENIYLSEYQLIDIIFFANLTCLIKNLPIVSYYLIISSDNLTTNIFIFSIYYLTNIYYLIFISIVHTLISNANIISILITFNFVMTVPQIEISISIDLTYIMNSIIYLYYSYSLIIIIVTLLSSTSILISNSYTNLVLIIIHNIFASNFSFAAIITRSILYNFITINLITYSTQIYLLFIV